MRHTHKQSFFIILILLITSLSAHAQDIEEKHTVLVLHGLWNAGVWESHFTDSLIEELHNDPNINLDISYEFLGLELVPDGEEPEEITEHLRYKNEINPVDLVISVLPSANSFLLEYGEEIFASVPKIFVLPSSDDVDAILDLPQSTIVKSASQTAIQNTLNNIPDLLPNTEQIYIIAGRGDSDLAYLSRAEDAVENTGFSGIEINYLIGTPIQTLKDHISNLPENSAIFFASYEEDIEGNRYTSVEIMEELAPISTAPIFSFFDTMFGRGIVGGNLTSSDLYGETAANIARDIFSGNQLSDDVQLVGNTSYMYDWRELQRWQIPESRLPAESDVQFKTFSFWEANAIRIILTIVFILIQTGFIITLLILLGQRRRTEAATLKREAEFRAIFENSRDAITVSTGGVTLMVNPAFVEMFGYQDASKMIGKPSGYNLIPGENKRIEGYAHSRASNKDVPIRYETRGRTRQGDEFDIEIHVATYQLEDELFIVAILRNISERKRLETVTREAEVLQSELDKEKKLLGLRERFISILSHEFRNPLAVLQSSLDLLTHYRTRLSIERRDEILQKMGLQITRLDKMIDDTLMLFRSQSEHLEFAPESINLEQFCRDIIAQVELTDKQAHEFIFRTNGTIPNVMIDKTILKHILVNLLSNSTKYSPEKTTIHLELSASDDMIQLSVKDKGIGVPEKDQELLFQTFHRASNVGKVKGSGLGLSIVQQYTAIHGGHIEFESELNKGSTFKVILPKVIAIDKSPEKSS